MASIAAAFASALPQTTVETNGRSAAPAGLYPRTAAPAAATPADSTSSGDASSGSAGTITSNDFLTLLVTELKNQDPTSTQDPNAYIDQLVQVNSLQQLISINQELATPATATPPPTTTTTTPDTHGQSIAMGDKGIETKGP